MKVALKAANGRYITAEGGGGTTLSVNREKVGEWEEWEVEDRGHGVCSFKSSGGFYLGVIPGTNEVTIDRREVGEWEEWSTIPGETDGTIAIQSIFTELFLHAVDGGDRGLAVDRDRTEIHAHESFISERRDVATESPAIVTPTSALRLKGPLRRFNSGNDDNDDKTFCDDNGPVFPFFCSDFTVLSLARRDRTAAANRIAKIAAHYPGFRTFLQVGGWTPFWDGLEVNLLDFRKWHYDPQNGGHHRPASLGHSVGAWTFEEFADNLRWMLRECRKHGIRLDITFGDMQILAPNSKNELDIHQICSRIVQEEGGTEVVALVEACNEFPINHFGSDSPESLAQLGRCLDVWRRNVPGVLTAMGAIISEEADKLEASGLYGNVNAMHVSRGSIEQHLKRTFGTVYWEGDWRHLEDAIWYTEPIGPGKDSYEAESAPSALVATYMLHGLLGAGSCFFSGPAVRGTEELDSVWGFKELPEIARQLLPRDVHLWQRSVNRERSAVMYWHKDKDFRAIVFEKWPSDPPFEIEEWTCHQGTAIRTGTGKPPQGMTGLLYGKLK